MTERFYFDIESDELSILDEEGVEAASFEEAIEEARSVIKEMAEDLNISNSSKKWTVIVRDKYSTKIERLPIEE